jgi:hypothetical protein
VPTFTYDISQYAEDYVRDSIKDLPGNAGQETLVKDLNIDLSCDITVHIAGSEVDTEANGNINFNSSHPDAIEQIISIGEDNFTEFLDKLSHVDFGAYAGLDIIETIRQDAIDQAFGEL